MREHTYYLVGKNGVVTHYWDRTDTRLQTPDGEDSPPLWIICFPKHDSPLYSMPMFLDSTYFWIRELDPWLAEEAMAFGYFELRSWYDFIKESIWFQAAKRHMRDTWEVLPTIPNVVDYTFFNQMEEMDRQPTYLGPQEGPQEDWIPLYKPGMKQTVDFYAARG